MLLWSPSIKIGIFPIKEKQGKGLKLLTPKQMLQRLPMALANVKAGNLSENLLNEIRSIKSCLYQGKTITRKDLNKCITQKWILYLWIRNSQTSDPQCIQWRYNTKMNAMFINFKIIKHLFLIDYYSILKIK